LDWLRAQNGKLTNFDALREHVDLFHPVRAGEQMFRPYRIGRLSLATQSFRAEDEAHFLKIIEQSVDAEIMQRVLAAHKEVAVMPYKVSDETINITVNGAQLSGAYRRILAPVTDLDGNRFTLVHSRRI
jgi:hypothetical protein